MAKRLSKRRDARPHNLGDYHLRDQSDHPHAAWINSAGIARAGIDYRLGCCDASLASHSLGERRHCSPRIDRAALFVYTGAVMMQCRWWWRDLFRRCPICLEGLRLPLAEGTADRVLLSPISTESVCIHGHGVLLENCWLRSFRRQDSHWEQLIRG